MRTLARQTFAFIFRDYHLTRRYLSWVIVFTAYSFVGAVTIALIGVAADDEQLTITLVLGALMWNFLSVMFDGIANAISYERWEGTLEYTFMAPVSRLVHLFGVSLWAAFYTLVQTLVVLGGLLLFVDLDLSGANLGGVLVVLLVGSVAFTGLGLMAATLPVMSPEHGAQATNIFQALLLLVSGVYYDVSVLPTHRCLLRCVGVADVDPAVLALLAGDLRAVGEPEADRDRRRHDRRRPGRGVAGVADAGHYGRGAGAAGLVGLRAHRSLGQTHG